MSREERNENRNPDDAGMEIFIPSERRHNKGLRCDFMSTERLIEGFCEA